MKKRDLGPVVELVVGQVQLHHVGTESCDVCLVTSFSDSTVIQSHDPGQEQPVCKQMQFRKLHETLHFHLFNI